MKTAVAAGSALVLALTAGLTMSAAAQNPPPAGTALEGSLKGKSLTFVSYGGVFQDGQMKALEDFVKISGVDLLSDGPTELAKIQAQVESRNVLWDVVDIGDVAPFVHCGSLFQKLDFSKIDVSKVPPGQVTPCSVPAMNYAVLFMYKKSTYAQNPPKSWADFFDTKNFPGSRAIPGYGDAEGYLIELALLNDGVAKDKLFPADIDRALNKYRRMRDHLILWQTGAQSQQMLESGEVDMAIVWSGRGKAAVANGAQYVPVWQDWVVIMEQLTIPTGVKNPDGSHALINAYLGQKAQEIMTEATSYSPINIDAQPKVDALTAQWLTSAPEKRATAYHYNLPYWVEHNVELNEKWVAFIAGN